MKFVKHTKYQCSAIVQPGEYSVDVWDNKQCSLTTGLVRCNHCDKLYCLTTHWHKHQDSMTEAEKDAEIMEY